MKHYATIDAARKNPALNLKVSIVDALKPYKDDPSYFISFTSINKIGINPTYPYSTPLGIYAYPLKYIYKQLVEKTIPFAMQRPLVQLLQIDIDKRKVLERDSYSSSRFKSDKLKLQKLFEEAQGDEDSILNNSPLKNLTWDDFVEEALEDFTKARPINRFWQLSMAVAKEALCKKNASNTQKATTWNTVFRKVGYLAAIDVGTESSWFIHGNELIQAVFFTRKAFKHIATYDNKRYEIPQGLQGERGRYPASLKFRDIVDIEIIKEIIKHNPEIAKPSFKASGLLATYNKQTEIQQGAIYSGELKNTVLGISLKFEEFNHFNSKLVVGTDITRTVLDTCIIHSGTYKNVELRNCTIDGYANFFVKQASDIRYLNNLEPCDFINCNWISGNYDYTIPYIISNEEHTVLDNEITFIKTKVPPWEALSILKKYKYFNQMKVNLNQLKKEMKADDIITLFH